MSRIRGVTSRFLDQPRISICTDKGPSTYLSELGESLEAISTSVMVPSKTDSSGPDHVGSQGTQCLKSWSLTQNILTEQADLASSTESSRIENPRQQKLSGHDFSQESAQSRPKVSPKSAQSRPGSAQSRPRVGPKSAQVGPNSRSKGQRFDIWPSSKQSGWRGWLRLEELVS